MNFIIILRAIQNPTHDNDHNATTAKVPNQLYQINTK